MNPYITTNGNGREVVAFYQQALGAEVLGVMTFGEGPSDPNYQMPEEAKDRIMHAHLKVGETDLMLSDTFPGQPLQVGNQVTIALMVENVDQGKRIFEALAEGGQVSMPFQQTFWSPGYGMVTDKFGTPWQVSTEAKQ
jgi:PhnB protein